MSRTSPEEYVLAIENIEQLLLEERRREAEQSLRNLPPVLDDVDLSVEVAEVLFRHDLLHHAERWSDRAYNLLLRHPSQYFSTRRDVLWLRVNIAWQRGHMISVATRLTELERHLGANDVANSLRLVADSITALISNRKREARRLANSSLLHGKGLLRVRFAAGVVLASPRILAELTRPPEGAGSEEVAYAHAAQVVLGEEGVRQAIEATDWSPHDRMAYNLATRYAAAVLGLVDLNASETSDREAVSSIPSIPGPMRTPRKQWGDTIEPFAP